MKMFIPPWVLVLAVVRGIGGGQAQTQVPASPSRQVVAHRWDGDCLLCVDSPKAEGPEPETGGVHEPTHQRISKSGALAPVPPWLQTWQHPASQDQVLYQQTAAAAARPNPTQKSFTSGKKWRRRYPKKMQSKDRQGIRELGTDHVQLP